MINDTAEKCRGCTIKHLSEALVWLDAETSDECIRGAYICGNLAHAANHFVHYSAEIADHIRQFRLDSINENLTLAISIEEARAGIEDLIKQVSAYREPPKVVVTVTPTPPTIKAATPIKKGGCRCAQKA